MQQNHPAQLSELAPCGCAEAATVAEAENSEHKTRAVITGWVRAHEHRSAEYRRAFKDMLTEEGFTSIPAMARDEDDGK